MTSSTMSHLSRRSFVAGAAALTGLALAGAQGVSSAQADSAQAADSAAAAGDQECDVLVIGGGISGALAALSAKAEGADVLLIEKQGFIGGSAALSSGFMVTCENDNFDDAIDDSWEKLEGVLHAVHDQSPDTEYPNWTRLANTFAEQSATIDFMVNLGMVAEFGEKSTAVTMWDGKGAGMMDALAKALDEQGVRVVLDCPASTLTVDESGAVVGATATAKDGEVAISAKKVILACGGASHNDEILTSYMPTYPDIDLCNMSAAGNTGDGFAMVEAVPAVPYDTMVFEGGGASIDDDWKAETGAHVSTNGIMVVDADGKRFTSEAPDGTAAGQMMTYYMVDHGSSTYWGIYDSTIDDDTKTAFEAGVAMGTGCVYFGETIDALAEAIGAVGLADEFAAYQDACAAGVDEAFGKNPEKLVAYVEDGGFYAVHLRPGSWGTIGGIHTDETGHAVDEAGEPIEGLFAVGEMSNREYFSDFYVGGNSLALNSTAGRIAGATAVSEL